MGADGMNEAFFGERLHQEIDRAGAHRLDRDANRSLRRDDDDRQVDTRLAHPRHDLLARNIGQAQVEQHQMMLAGFQRLLCGGAGFDMIDGKCLAAQETLVGPRKGGSVLDKENSAVRQRIGGNIITHVTVCSPRPFAM